MGNWEEILAELAVSDFRHGGFIKSALDEIKTLRERLEAAPAAPVEWFEMDWPDYHTEAMGCGLEDRNITDRYDAMRYGWDEAIELCAERLPEELYTVLPPAAPVELEPVAWRNVDAPNGILRYMTQKQYEANPKLQKYYEPYRCANCIDAAAVIAEMTQGLDEWIACHARVWKRLQLAHKAIEAMRVAGGSVEFQVAFDAAKGLVIGSELISEPLANPLANHEETSDCHGPDWTDRDGEYLK